jgi:hypothetical protein
MEYKLYRGQVFLGIVIHEIDNFPLRKGKFQPSDDFRSVASLFNRERCLLESGKIEEWRKVRDEILQPGLELRSQENNRKSIVNPLIHIDGTEVWWS